METYRALLTATEGGNSHASLLLERHEARDEPVESQFDDDARWPGKRAKAAPLSEPNRCRPNALGVRHGVPQGPDPTPRLAHQGNGVEPQRRHDLVDELDRRAAKPAGSDRRRVTQAVPRPVNGDRADALQVLQNRHLRTYADQ
jgi:hypothetical protein